MSLQCTVVRYGHRRWRTATSSIVLTSSKSTTHLASTEIVFNQRKLLKLGVQTNWIIAELLSLKLARLDGFKAKDRALEI